MISVGEGGYWEGKIGEREGWFPSDFVREVTMRHPPGTLHAKIPCYLEVIYLSTYFPNENYVQTEGDPPFEPKEY